MTTLKFIALTILGLGLGFGASQVIADNNDGPFVTDPEERDSYGFGCHMDEDYFMDHYIDQFSDENQFVIEAYIDSLLVEYEVAIDDLYDDYDLRHELIDKIFDFIEEQGFEPEEEYRHRHHMGW